MLTFIDRFLKKVLATKKKEKFQKNQGKSIVIESSRSVLERFLKKLFNLLHATGYFLYTLKTSKHQRFLGGIKRDQWYKMV